MGPTLKEKEKKKAKQQMGIRMDERQIVQARKFFIFDFYLFKFSFSDSRVFDRRNSSG